MSAEWAGAVRHGVVVAGLVVGVGRLGCSLQAGSCVRVLPFRRAKARAEMMKRREAGFDTNTANDKLPKYNALFDSNLRHFFENRNVQTHLYKTGLVSVRWAVGWTFGCAAELM